MATEKWLVSTRSGNPISILTTELNALAAGSGAITAAGIDNDADLDLFVDLELAVDFVSAPTDGGLVKIYFARSVDGTTFDDAAGGATPTLPANGYVGSFRVAAVTTAQRLMLPQVEVPVRDFKVLLVNGSSQPFPATGSTLKGLFYKRQS